MPTIHYKHLHQHQQSFVTLNSPSPFDAAPQTRCIPQITIYPELEAKNHELSTNGDNLIYLLIYLFSFPPPCEIQYTLHVPFCLLSPGPLRQFSPSTHLLYIAYSSVSLQALPTLCLLYSRLHLIYPHLLLLN